MDHEPENIPTEWRDRQIPPEAAQQLLAVREFPERMAAARVEVKAGCRFLSYRNRILRIVGPGPPRLMSIKARDLKWTATMGLELQHALFAAEQLQAIDGWEPVLKQMAAGRDLPSDGGNSWPRDHQFHAFVAALFASAGYYPRHLEPDIRVQIDGFEVSCAVKRAHGRNGPYDLLRLGKSQLQKHRVRGFVIIDVSAVISPWDNAVAVDDHRPFHAAVTAALKNVVFETYGKFRYPYPSASYFGSIWTATAMCFDTRKGCVVPATSDVVVCAHGAETPQSKRLVAIRNILFTSAKWPCL